MNCKFTLLLLLPILLDRTPATTSQTVQNTSCGRTCQNSINIDIEKEDCTCYNSRYSPSELWDTSDGNIIEGDFPLELSIFPFLKDLQAIKRSAFNLTFVIKEKSVIGLSFRFMNNCYDDPNKIISRYYNWSTSNKSFENAVIMNDDTYFDHNRHEKYGSFCNLQVSALSSSNRIWKPMNYTFEIPSIADIDEQNLCQWRSLILIDLGSFDPKEKTINVIFNAAPSSFNVSTYKVELKMSNLQEVLWSTSLTTIQHTNVVKVQKVVGRHDLLITVQVFDQKCSNQTNNCCDASKSAVFRLFTSSAFDLATDHFKIVSVFIIILVILCVVTLIVALTHHRVNIYYKNRYPAKVIKVFMVYSYDVPKHLKVVESFADYLQRFCHCEVLLASWHIQNQSPNDWVNKCLAVADYVVIVWSRGAHLKIRNNLQDFKSEQSYLGTELFRNCIAKIRLQIEDAISSFDVKSRFVNVCLPYTPKENIPAPMSYLTTFLIPDHFNAFLCQIHDVLPKGYSNLLHRLFYPHLPFSDLKKSPEADQLLTAIDAMQDLENEGQWYRQLCQHPIKRQSTNKSDLLMDDVSSSESLDASRSNAEEVDEEKVKFQVPVPKFPPNVDELPIFGDHQSQNQVPTQENEDDDLSDLSDAIFGP